MSGKMALMVLAIWGILNNEPQWRGEDGDY